VVAPPRRVRGRPGDELIAGLVLSIFVSLDGYAAGPDGEIEFFSEIVDEELDGHMARALEGYGGLVLGRSIYEMFAGYWPSANTEGESGNARIARRLNELRKYVVTTRPEGLVWEPATPVGGDLREEVARVKREAEGDLVLFGGARTAQALMELDLIDEYRLLVCPVALGAGQSLFGDTARQRNLDYVDATSFASSGVVQLRYRAP
jgi:dihydrofolate reductase